MSRYMPVYQYPDMMPVDISFVFEDEKPAGKHGFCKVQGESFVFEDGTPAKFWGVIFNGASCFPDHAYAEGVAQRLAQTGGDIHQIHVVLPSTDTSDLTDIRGANEKFERENPKVLVSDNGQLWRDLGRRIGGVDSPRTQAVFGVIGQRKANGAKPIELELSSMKVQSNTDLATIALSSLTNDPIDKSDSMLLSAVGRASNRGQRMDGEKLLDIGTTPIEAEIIDANIAIKTDNTKLRVWSVNSEGFYCGNPEVTHEDGWMKFHIGPNYPGLYYLIMEY